MLNMGKIPGFPADDGAATPSPYQGPGILASQLAPKPQGKPSTIGIILDVIAGLGGATPTYAMRREHERQDGQNIQKSLLAQQLEMHKWQQQQAYKRANPDPYRFEANNGDQMEYDPLTGQPRTLYKDPTARLVRNYDGTWSTMPGAPTAPVTAPVGKLTPIAPGGAGSGQRTFQPSAVMDSLIQQESGGRPGVLGPMTKYGQAQGLTQMLPATAQGIAKKLGVPWRADLMTGTSEAAAAYQRALGQAYLEEGYQATGNIRDALHYYHGGPSKRLWGPKTRKYADSVISRLGSQ